jgi:hypothetical protein
VSRWLTRFKMKTVERLQALNAVVIEHILPSLDLRTVTVDVDGVVVSTGLQVERAFTSGRCRATTRLWRTWRRPPTCCG